MDFLTVFVVIVILCLSNVAIYFIGKVKGSAKIAPVLKIAGDFIAVIADGKVSWDEATATAKNILAAMGKTITGEPK